MKLPNWFKILWWWILLLLITYFLFTRYSDLIAGKATPADIIIFLVWISLWLLPLVSEINILGIMIKKEVEAIKRDFTEKIEAIRNEIQNSIDVRSQFNPHLTLQMPPPDSQLPTIEERVRSEIQRAMLQYGIQQSSVEQDQITVSESETYLFSVRNNIERELRRIYSQFFPNDTRERYTSVIAISRVLTNNEIISPGLAEAIRQVYRSCSAAIHGEDVSEAQVNFVRDTARELLSTLRAIN